MTFAFRATMLSTVDLERLITVKRREIDKEKTRLGLASPRLDEHRENNEGKNNTWGLSTAVPGDHDAEVATQGATEEIPPDLERYIRRYIGLPGMLKAGEYSPNNPLIRGERAAGDALLGLGEYERRRNTLRKLRQQQYREYLDQQAKKKQEEKEQAERERREREQREKEREEREREREREREALERDRASPEWPRAYTSTVFSTQTISKVDTGVQTNGTGRPLSVAVQTDDVELYRMSPPPPQARARAERELSPRAPRPISFDDFQDDSLLLKKHEQARSYKPSLLDADAIQMRNENAEKEAAAKRQSYQQELKNQIMEQQRIREERKAREKLLEQAEMRRLEGQLRLLRAAQESELGQQLDAAGQMKENATDYEKKRTALQKEIDLEQKALLRVAAKPSRYTHTSQSDPSSKLPSKLPLYYPPIHGKQNAFTKSLKEPFSTNIPDNSIFSHNYDVDSYLRKNLNPSKESLFNRLDTASSALSLNSKYLNKFITDDRKTDYSLNERQTGYSTDTKTGYSPDRKSAGYNDNENIMKISFNSNGARKITGYRKDEMKTFTFNDRKTELTNDNEIRTKYRQNDKKVTGNSFNDNEKTGFTLNDAKKLTAINDKKVIVEKALIHDRPKEKKYEPSNRNDNDNPIPVLRHSPVNAKIVQENKDLSEAMQVVDDKWKVPAVQKNILKSLPNEEGKSVSILTQLGSIRRQLQLEQLKLDNMLPKDDA